MAESKPMEMPKRNNALENRNYDSHAKTYSNSFGLFLGVYNAEVLGANPYANAFWDYYPNHAPYFFEGTFGIGTAQSTFSKSFQGRADTFKNNLLFTMEGLAGYTLTLDGFTGEPYGGSYFPYFVAGITGIYQGGNANIGGVLGFGQRLKFPGLSKKDWWGINYGLHDHIYSQKITSEPYLTQNFILLIGAQYYY